MKSVVKPVGVFSIGALTVIAMAQSFAETNLPDQTVCRRALNFERSGWVEGSAYTEEASKRGLTFRACSEMTNPPVSVGTEQTRQTYNSPVTNSGATEQSAFLEAATYFITALDVAPGRGDVVSGTQIELGKYQIVIYLDNNGCAVRVRATTPPYTIWQFDFCKITHWQSQTQYGFLQATWFGEFDAFCIFKGLDKNENYTGYIGPNNSQCSLDGQTQAASNPNYHRAYNSMYDINDLVDVNGKGRKKGDYSRRPVDRMIASFKYIVTLLSGKPY